MTCLQEEGTYKPHEIRWDDVAKEATGKLFVMPRTDKHGPDGGRPATQVDTTTLFPGASPDPSSSALVLWGDTLFWTPRPNQGGEGHQQRGQAEDVCVHHGGGQQSVPTLQACLLPLLTCKPSSCMCCFLSHAVLA